MKEEAYKALINMGYSPTEARETVEAASDEDLALLVPKSPAKVKSPAKAKKASQKAKPKPESKAKPKAFDPVAAAMGIVEEAKERPTVRYMVRPLFKLKLVDEVDEATFKGIAEEMKTIGGYWFEPLKCFIFESDPTEKL